MKFSNSIIAPGFLASLLFFTHPAWSPAQVPGPLDHAAGTVGQAMGPQSLGAVISVEGRSGSPQPTVWDFTVADPSSPNGVRILRAGPMRVLEREDPGAGYPDRVPGGFFSWADVKVDALSAFQAADVEARSAMIGFDSVHYLLRAREGTNSPLWVLTLLDVNNRLVGRIEISASSAKIERRVWMRPAGPGGRAVRIEDSLAPYQNMQPAPPAPATPVPQPLPNSLAPTGPNVPVNPPAPTVYPPIHNVPVQSLPVQPPPTMPDPRAPGGVQSVPAPTQPSVQPLPQAPSPTQRVPGYTPLPSR